MERIGTTAWWVDDQMVALAAGLLVAGLVGAALLHRRTRRRRAQRWAAWRREHARRLPWELFRRRGTSLRLTDQRAPDARRRREP